MNICVMKASPHEEKRPLKEILLHGQTGGIIISIRWCSLGKAIFFFFFIVRKIIKRSRIIYLEVQLVWLHVPNSNFHRNDYCATSEAVSITLHTRPFTKGLIHFRIGRIINVLPYLVFLNRSFAQGVGQIVHFDHLPNMLCHFGMVFGVVAGGN